MGEASSSGVDQAAKLSAELNFSRPLEQIHTVRLRDCPLDTPKYHNIGYHYIHSNHKKYQIICQNNRAAARFTED